ncbi:EF-Hand 1, calcium-binding site,EF-hand domain pair,EF-hand domain [Cinara cedri]|uniref:EF-Hand 1, calcium-binding site,EF-hand domain pair,EF-hand domain n=1 Tax=Cinara cedri TaxID=506608 RepID=A0A5E4NDG5_9HEMI|nr:EF-Hand 1, calcium-binding site,EF-hand domain pair,EF-hand domain [Cinara cedri]
MEPYELYKIDFHLFEIMFRAISPLAKNSGADNIVVRIFKLMDMNDDGFLNFRELTAALGLTSTVDIALRFKILYLLHLPPLLTNDLLFVTGPNISENGAEYASDAVEYFDTNILSGTISESSLNDLKLLRNFADQKPSSKTPHICLPSMSEDQFVALCNTMYDLIGHLTVNQEMYKNISKISAILLEIGNFNKEESNKSNNQNNGEWFINAEQFVATALTFQELVDFIGQKPNIVEVLNKLRNN